MPIRRGTILAFEASGHDDTAWIVIGDHDSGVHRIACDFVRTLRSFDDMFGGVVDAKHRKADLSRIVGREVFFALDGFGTIAAISSAERASEEVRRLYEEGRRSPRVASN
jgi:hypothetical protein